MDYCAVTTPLDYALSGIVRCFGFVLRYSQEEALETYSNGQKQTA